MADNKADSSPDFRRVLSPNETGMAALVSFGCAEGLRAPLPVLEHRHRDKLECIVCVSGIQTHLVSGVQYTIYPGECLFIHQDELHCCMDDQPAPSQVFWLQADLAAGFTGDPFLGVSGAAGESLRTALLRYDGRRAAVPEETLASLVKAFSLFQGASQLGRIQAQALLLAALLEIVRGPTLNQALTPDIDRAKQYILLHTLEQLDIDELLLASGLTMKEFLPKFEAQIGMKPRAYISQIKIERLRREMRESKLSDFDLSCRYHFQTVSIFRSQFKKCTGMSVRQYRKELRKEAKRARD